jgi:hypothetical protein
VNITKEVTPLGHLIQLGNCLLFRYVYKNLFYEASASFNEGGHIQEAKDHKEELRKKVPR